MIVSSLLVLRLALMLSLYGFLAWAFITLWRDLKMQSKVLALRQPPPVWLWVEAQGDSVPLSFNRQVIAIGRGSVRYGGAWGRVMVRTRGVSPRNRQGAPRRERRGGRLERRRSGGSAKHIAGSHDSVGIPGHDLDGQRPAGLGDDIIPGEDCPGAVRGNLQVAEGLLLAVYGVVAPRRLGPALRPAGSGCSRGSGPRIARRSRRRSAERRPRRSSTASPATTSWAPTSPASSRSPMRCSTRGSCKASAAVEEYTGIRAGRPPSRPVPLFGRHRFTATWRRSANPPS